MPYPSFLARVAPMVILVCVFLPGTAPAQQVGVGMAVGTGPVPGWYGPGWYGTGPHEWGYPGLAGGPYLTTDYPLYPWPGYRGAEARLWSPAGHRPPVPVYGPLPCVVGPAEVVPGQTRPLLGLGLGYVGWIGPFRASPRLGPTVSVWAAVEPPPAAAPAAVPGPSAGCLVLSVRVPQPGAEVYVDGVKTAQTGTDRTFESPPLEEGKEYRYELTARWIEGGAPVERKKVVTGKPGEVVRVDLTAGADSTPNGK